MRGGGDAPLGATLRALLEEGRAQGIFPDAAVWVSQGGRHRATAFAGDAGARTRWDLASLTKPRAVVDLVMVALAAGELDLDDPLTVVPTEAPPSLRALLAHRSGLPAWIDLPSLAEARLGPWRAGAWSPGSPAARELVTETLSAALAARSGGDNPTRYSDLGYILLGWQLEARLGAPLARLVPGYNPRAARGAAGPFAPTGPCPFRGRALVGEVHDLNAWLLGGAAGHAGLFATLGEVAAWAQRLADADAGRPSPYDAGVVRELWAPTQRSPGASWVLGWDTPSPGRSSAGALISPDAVGHLGFTGTSVWIDRARDAICVLLTNRVAAASDTQAATRAFRPRLHDAVWAALDASP